MKISPAPQAALPVAKKISVCVRISTDPIDKCSIAKISNASASMIFSWVLILVAALFFQPTVRAQSAARSADRPPTASRGSPPELSSNDQNLFDELNRERTSRGLS